MAVVAPFRWGILSTARINRAVIPRLHASPRHEALAVASRDVDRARAYAAEWSIRRAYGSYDDLLDDPDVEGVYISLPNSLHVEWSLRSLRAGKHVLCEKPLAPAPADIDRLAETAAATGRHVAEAFMYRHHPRTMEVRRLVRDGAIGELRSIHGAFTYVQARDHDIRLDSSLGGGSLWDIGCYPVSFALYVAGEAPTEVFAMIEPGPGGVDVACAGTLRFRRGFVCQFECGFRAAPRTAMVLVGTDGVIDIPAPFRPDLDAAFAISHRERIETRTVSGPPVYLGELDDLADAARDARLPRVTLGESRLVAATLAACVESAASRRSVGVAA